MGYVSIVAGLLTAVYALYHFQVRPALQKEKEHTTRRSSVEADEKKEVLGTGRSSKPETGSIQTENGYTISPSLNIHPPEATVTVAKEDVPSKQPISVPATDFNMMPPPPAPSKTRSSSPPRLKPPTFGNMPAPPRPSSGSVRPPPSAAASLRVPQTKVLSNTSMAPSSLGVPKKQTSRQVQLKPGHSPMDWAALTKNPNSRLRGKDAPDNLIKVTPSQVKQQNGRKGKDAWTTYQGKVYNITPYLPFHPGGEGEIMRGAGKDSVKLFMEVHPWVNWDGMLAECLVGILVNEDEAERGQSQGTNLDDMD